MQEFLRQQLEVMATRPSTEEMLERIRLRKAGTHKTLAASDLLATTGVIGPAMSSNSSRSRNHREEDSHS